MLTVNKLRKSFGGLHAVDDVSFKIARGKITALIGPNGAGKTTLFNLISGTMKTDGGSIMLDADDITALSIEERSRRGLARSFQLSRPFRNLTVEDHLLLALERDDDLFWRNIFFKRETKTEKHKHLREVLDRVSLDAPLNKPAADLSYGQSKLLGIAMAMIHPHQLMLLDEPVAGVNPVVRETISHVLRKLREQGETVFVIEHDMEFIMPLADEVIVLDHGRMIAHGTPKEIQQDPDALHAYLGAQL